MIQPRMAKLAHRLKPEVSLPMPSNYYTESPEASDSRFPASSTQAPYLPPSGDSRDADSSPLPPSNPTHSTSVYEPRGIPSAHPSNVSEFQSQFNATIDNPHYHESLFEDSS